MSANASPRDSVGLFFDLLARAIDKSSTLPTEWAEAHRIIRGVPYSFEGFEYLRVPHDDLHNDIVVAKAAQSGWTELFINQALFFLDCMLVDVIYAFPTEDDITDFSQARLKPSIESSDYLSRMFTDVSNVRHKRAGFVNLYLRSAGSSSQMKGVPAGAVIFDELDEMDAQNVEKGRERVSGQMGARWWLRYLSTPTIPTHGVWAMAKTAELYEYFMPCWACGKEQRLVWPNNIRWAGRDPRSARYVCDRCGETWTKDQHSAARAAGHWRRTQKGETDRRAYHISQLYTMAQNPVKIVSRWLKVEEDERLKQEFFNSKLGLPFEMEGARISRELVEAARAPGLGVQETSVDATMGVDLGGAAAPNYVEIAEWREGVKFVVQAKRAGWSELDDLMLDYRVRLCVVDAQPEATKALEFAKRWPGRVYLCYYVDGLTDFFIRNDEQQVVKAWRTVGIDKVLERFRQDRVVLPCNLPAFETYAAHHTALVRVWHETKRGLLVPRYVNDAPDHYAHAAVYNEIASEISPMDSEVLDVWSEPAQGEF